MHITPMLLELNYLLRKLYQLLLGEKCVRLLHQMEKNFTLLVFNAEFPELNISKNWKVNITHTNENISFSGTIEDAAITIKTDELVDLVDYFSDADYFDKKINQKINFTIETINGGTNVQVASTFSDWILSLKTDVDGDETITERIKVVAYEYDMDNSSLGNVSSNEFNVRHTRIR